MLSYRGRSIRYLDYDQTTRFFAIITHPRDRALFVTIYHYGLRVSEVPLLHVDDVDLARGRIVIQRVKSGIGGERPLFQTVARLIEAYLPMRLPTGSALFTGRQGDLQHHRIQQLFKRYAKQAGLGDQVSVHSLRHSIATHLLDAGQGIEFVQDHLGHVNVQNTLIYTKVTDRRRETVFRQLEQSGTIVIVRPVARRAQPLQTRETGSPDHHRRVSTPLDGTRRTQEETHEKSVVRHAHPVRARMDRSTGECRRKKRHDWVVGQRQHPGR